MPEEVIGAVWAFCWGVAAGSGVLVGAILGLVMHLRHRAIAAIMSLGAGVLLSLASAEVASEALMRAGAISVLSLWSGITLGTAATTALSFYFLSDLGSDATAILKAYGAGALIAMAAETMIPEAFHNGPRYSGVLAAAGFAGLILLGDLAR